MPLSLAVGTNCNGIDHLLSVALLIRVSLKPEMPKHHAQCSVGDGLCGIPGHGGADDHDRLSPIGHGRADAADGAGVGGLGRFRRCRGFFTVTCRVACVVLPAAEVATALRV